MSIAYIVTAKNNISITCNGKNFNISPESSNYNQVVELLDREEDVTAEELLPLLDLTLVFNNYSRGNITFLDGVIFYKGEPINNAVTKIIVKHMQEGKPVKGLMRFLDKLMGNPSYNTVNQLYSFLETHKCVITTGGNFLAYKSVRSTYYDWYSNTVFYKGEITMPRNTVDDNLNRGCSVGLHVGDITYVKNFYNEEGRRILLVEVDPADVVCVPKEDHRKVRVCKLKVLQELDPNTLEPKEFEYPEE